MQSRSFDFRKPATTGTDSFKEVYSQAQNRFQEPTAPVEPTPTASAATTTQPIVKSANRTPWVLTGVLTLGLIAMSSFALIQEREFQDQLASNSSSAVAGVSERQEEYVISGDSFSLILGRQAPTYFNMDRDIDTPGLFEERGSRTSEYVSRFDVSGSLRTSGIRVEVLESDNKETPESFTNLVIGLLADKQASVEEVDVATGNDYTLTRLTTQTNSSEVYYTGVTAENYYVITVFSDASTQEITSEANAYTQLFIPGLYLN